jgi:hypothetical protein
MKNLIVFGVMSLFFSSCGVDQPKNRSVPSPVSLTDTSTTTTVTTIPSVTAPVYSAPGEDVYPISYTFIDTPDANLCFDAFLRAGISVPSNTVARTLDATSWRSEGIAISDLETSAIPIMNIIHLRQECSNVMFQFYNRNGFYCIVKNTSKFSNVRIQRTCTAKMTEIEPITHDSQNSSLNLFWFWPTTPTKDSNATTGAYNSIISELPCVP